MRTLEVYKHNVDFYKDARDSVAVKYRRDEPVQGPLNEQASIYEAMSLIHEGTRIDVERLLSAFTIDLTFEQQELGNA